jgi:hypothetical protein
MTKDEATAQMPFCEIVTVKLTRVSCGFGGVGIFDYFNFG